MARKKRKRIMVGQRADDVAVLSCEKKITDEKESSDAEYELRRSLEICIRQVEAALDRMEAEDERQVNQC